MSGEAISSLACAGCATPAPPTDIEPAWKTIAELAKALGRELGFRDLAGLRKDLEDTAEAAQ